MGAAALELWDEQVPVIEEVREAFNEGHRSVLMQAPTGFGKTTCFIYIALHAALLGNTTHIIVHRDELITQVVKRFESCSKKFGVDFGIIAAGYKPAPWCKIQVCSLMTYLVRVEKKRVKAADLYVIDEAHHSAAATYVALWEFAPLAHFLGVTATPKRTDGKPLNVYSIKTGRLINGKEEEIQKPLYTKIVCGPSVASLIPKRLVQPLHYAPSEPLDLSGLRLKEGDYNADDLVQLYKKSKLTGDAIKWYQRLAYDRPGVAFCANIEHCNIVAKAYQDAGISAEVIDGTMKKSERRKLIQRFADGDVKILCSANLITEGFDIPAIGCVIILVHTVSIIKYLQMIGRGLRKDPGKDNCVVLDHARLIDNKSFGLATAARTWSLDGTTELSEQGSPKQCLECQLWSIGTLKACPNCGTEFKEAKKSSGGGGAASKDYSMDSSGQMVLCIDEAERAAQIKEAKRKQQQAQLEEKEAYKSADPYGAYVALGEKRGYRNPHGWARQMINLREGYKAKYSKPTKIKRAN